MKQKILKNLISLSGAEAIARVSGFIITVFIARYFSVEEYGLIGFFTAVLSYFFLFINFGYDTYGTREAAREGREAERILNSIFSQKLMTAFIIFILYLIFVFYGVKENEKLLALLFGATLFAKSININWFFRGIENMKFIFYSQMIESLLYLSLAVLLILLFKNLYVIPVSMFISQSAGSIYFIKKVPKDFKLKIGINLKSYINLFKKSSLLGFTSLFAIIYLNIDLVMLNYMKGEFDTGIYTAASKLFIVGTIPLHLLLGAFFPQLSRVGLSASNEFKTLIKNYFYSIFLAALLISAVVYFFPSTLIKIVYGDDYKLSALPLEILGVNIFVVGLSIIYGNPLVAWGKQSYLFAAIAIGAAANVILNLIYIPKYSFLGAAYTTLISEIIVFIFAFLSFLIVTRRVNKT